MITLAKKSGEPNDWPDSYSRACEDAFIAANDPHHKKSEREKERNLKKAFEAYRCVEFPVESTKKTKTTPSISWSVVPKFGQTFLKRKEVFEDGMPDCVKLFLKSEPRTTQSDFQNEVSRPESFLSEKNFLDETVQVEKKKKDLKHVTTEKKEKKESKQISPEKKETQNFSPIKKAKKEKKDKVKKLKKKQKKKKKNEESDEDVSEDASDVDDVVKKRHKSEDVDSEKKKRNVSVDKSNDRGNDTEDTTNKKQKKKKKKKNRKKDLDDLDRRNSDENSPLQDEPQTPVEQSADESSVLNAGTGLANIGTWEVPTSDLQSDADLDTLRSPDAALDHRRRDVKTREKRLSGRGDHRYPRLDAL